MKLKGLIFMKYTISYLVLSVGQMCNLRCKNCANFAPYAPAELRRYPIENIIADFESLFKVVGRIDRLQIQGGEPLTYTDLPKLTAYLNACKEVVRVEIATNGTITPKDEWWHNFSMSKVTFRVSNYPQNRGNLEAFATKAQAYRVNVRMYDFASREALWYDCGGMNTPRENDDRIVAERFNRCAFKGCLTLENGELHRCSRATNAHTMQHFNNTPPQTLSAFAATKICATIWQRILFIRALKLLVVIATALTIQGKFSRRNSFDRK